MNAHPKQAFKLMEYTHSTIDLSRILLQASVTTPSES